MSDAPAAIPTKPSPAGLPFEQQLYMRSPFGIFTTTIVVFVLLFGAFLAVALLEHVEILSRDASGARFAFTTATWPAIVLSLLCCTALAMQRYVRLAEARDAPDYARILSGGIKSARAVTSLAPPRLRMARSTLIGIAIGLAISAVIRWSEYREGHIIPPLTMAWYAGVNTFMIVLFTRGVEMTRAGSQSYARTLGAELQIDLLRTDTLAVLGRSAARSSLIWFVISAVACLFFVGGDLNWLTIALIAACAIMGLALFISIMSRIHRQILAAKRAELEHIRGQIEAMRARLAHDDHAATRLHGLLAFEKRIADAPEWPFDQSTLVRVAAYILIPTVPWFGQAVVQYFVEHMAHG
ncbi:MAG: hypothetical protein ACREHE_00685 [Rhizomicrobium sp.]